MKELIKEADEMYDKLMRVIRHINTPEFDKDDSIAIIEASQLLRRLVERKDNIVDLSEVWKDDSHIPQTDKKVVVINNNGTFINGYLYIDERTFTVKTDSYRIIISDRSDLYRWAYLDDLLPKGDCK